MSTEHIILELPHHPPSFLLSLLLPSSKSTSSRPISIYQGSDSNDTPTPVSPDNSRPYVTLTFAQSLDAKIAGKEGKQLTLSGKESMIMTHWMRTMHDGILVGINTALNDNPQLNTRHLPPLPETYPHRYHLPRPIILDTNLRFSTSSKLLKNYAEGRGRRPWVVGAVPHANEEVPAWMERKRVLQEAGARVIEVQIENGSISISALLSTLRTLGIRSLMVEGGAQVIKSFLASARPSNSGSQPSVDTIIITVAPTIVGKDGVGYGEDMLSNELPKLEHVHTELFGRDSVVALKVV